MRAMPGLVAAAVWPLTGRSRRAHGHEVYGPEYEDAILGQVHKAVECCDSPQSFFTMHSLGGGTGACSRREPCGLARPRLSRAAPAFRLLPRPGLQAPGLAPTLSRCWKTSTQTYTDSTQVGASSGGCVPIRLQRVLTFLACVTCPWRASCVSFGARRRGHISVQQHLGAS